MNRAQAEVLWREQRTAQIDWMDEQGRAARKDPERFNWPEGPYTRPCPEMTVPPPYSPEWYSRFRP